MALTSAVGRLDGPDRRRRYAFLVGSVLGGAAVATTLYILSGFASPLPSTVSALAIVIVGAIALADAMGADVPRLQAARQIPNTAFDRARRFGSARFGFELGTGVRTYLSDPSPQIIAAALLLVARPWSEALVTGMAFGLARGWLPLSRSIHPDRTRWDLLNARRHRAVDALTIVLIVFGALLGRGLI